MRHYSIRLLAVLAITSALIAGCNSSTSPGTTQADGSMIATVNGTSWTSLPLVGTIAVHDRASNTLTITGTSVDLTTHTQTLALILINPHVGLDSLGLGNTGTWSDGTPGQDSYITAGFGAGTINISKYDTTTKLVSGTFNFTGHQPSNISNSVTVTNGSFVNISYTEH